ncbi:MAG: WhiB family transcriptional regulator [Actinomycetota bacterium]
MDDHEELPCAGKTVLFFSTTSEAQDQAKALCRGCGVWQRCLEVALGYPPARHHGVWGGMTPEERRALVASGQVPA